MSSVAKFIGTVAGIAALIPGPHQPIAAAVAVAANVTAQLTAKKPPAMTGSVNRISIGANQPKPYLIGETYYGGNRINHEGFGGKVSKVNNPYMLLVDVYSGAGPIAGFVAPYLDFVPVTLNGNAATGYAANHLYVYHQLGRTPEPAALSTHWNGAQTWGPQHKLSSYAAISWCLRFDEDGKRFAAGTPQTGAVWRGVLAYDPRKDSTYPGGSGPHRWASPTDKVAFAAAKATWEWTRCPGLQGLRYALGTWERDENNPDATYRKTFGIGIPVDGIRVADFVALANVCDANGWHVDGVIHEPGNRDDNLKNILIAGGAERCWIGGKLGLKLSAPRVALDTITEYDLATDDVEIGAMQGWESRLNTIIPKYRSADHKWEYVPSTAVTIASYLAEDGEEKAEERQYNLVQSKDQAAQLAAYELLDARELGEIVLTCKPRLRRYGAGDLLIVHLPDDGLVNQPCVVLKRTFDPVSMTVELILRGETAAKHDFALGRTGTAPATPRLTGGEILDDVAVDTRIAGSNGTNGTDAPLVITQWSIDGVTNWHNEYQLGDRYFRMSNDGGNVFGPAVLAVGEDGADGVRGTDGGYFDSIFRYRTIVPRTPEGTSPADWYDAPTPTSIRDKAFSARDNYLSGDQWLEVQPGEVYRITGYIQAAAANRRGHIGLNVAGNRLDGTTFNWIAAGGRDPGTEGPIDGYIVIPAGCFYMRPWAQIDATENPGTLAYNFKLENLPPLFLSRAKRNADGSLASAWSAPVRISGEDGKETLSAYLTNESFSHPTDANGAPTAITSGVGDGQMKVFLGSRDVTPLCTFTVQTPFWLGVTVDATGNYSANYLGNDNGYAFIIAVFQGRAIAKQLSATRSKAGTDGTSPPLLTLTASDQSFSLDTNGTPRAKTIRLTATPQNNTTGVLWALYRADGTPLTNAVPAPDLAAVGAASRHLDYLNIEIDADRFHGILAEHGGESITYGVQLNGEAASDKVSIVRLRDGAKGRDGVDGVPGVNGTDGTTWYPYFAYANSPDGSIDFTTGSPDGRAYVGFASGTSPTEPQSPGFYTWSAYRGPAFGLTGTNVAIAGDQIVKTTSGGWGTGGAYSTTGFRGGAIATFRAGDGHAGDIMAGLNSDPATDDSYASIDYCWYLHSNGHAYVFESGAHVAVDAVDIAGFGSGTFSVEYDNRAIRYIYNGVVYHEHAVAADQVLYFDAALAGNAGVSRLANVAFASVGRAGVDGIPGTNGTNGQAGRDGRDGSNGSNGADGRNGSDGRTSYVHYAYADSADGHANFTTGAAEGRSFVGIYVDYSEPDSGDPNAYRWTRLRGLDGNNGLPGTPGADGRTPYVHTAYANSPNGHQDFTTDDAQALNRRYIGLRTDYEVADSQNPDAYVWSISRGADGSNGRDGTNGTNGTNGVDGFSIETATPVFAIPCFSNGNPDPARWSGGSGQARLRKGGAVIGGVRFAIISQSAMTGLSVNGSGDYAFSGLSADTGFFVVRATYAGQVYDLKVDVKKVRDGSAAFTAAVPINSSDASSQTTVPGGRVVRVSGAASYFLNHEGAYQPRMRIYVRNLTDGGPDQFLGSVLGSNAYRFNVGSPDEPVYDTAPGSVAAAFEFTSAAADKQYQYRCTMEGEYGGYADSISGQLMLEVIA